MSQPPTKDNPLGNEVAALEELAHSPTPAGLRMLRAALASDSAVVRQVAATSLGKVGNTIAVPDLILALHDPVSEVRRSAIWALGQIGNENAADALHSALADTDADVRRAAIWALGRVEKGGIAPGVTKATNVDGGGRKPRRLVLVILGLAALLLAATLVVSAFLWAQPLGPQLVGLQGTPQPATSQPGAPPPAMAEAECSGPPVMKLLILGLDSEGYYDGTADAVRVARIDFTQPSIILMGIPRDLWVTIPGLERAGIYEEKLKMAYPYGNIDQVPGGGPSLTAQTLALNLGLRVDRYAATDFNTFKSIIDDMGGIDIYLKKDVGTSEADPPYFPAGWAHMDGETALSYARVRPENSSDLARMDRQNQVITAMRTRLTSDEILPQVPGMINRVRGEIATDLSPAELSSLLCITQRLEPEQMSIVKIDKPMVLSVTDSFGHERLLPDQDKIRAFVQLFEIGDIAALRKMAAQK